MDKIARDNIKRQIEAAIDKAMADKKKASDTEQRLIEIHARMDGWNSFVRDLQVPADLAPAFQTGRTELLCLAKQRDMKAEEVAVRRWRPEHSGRHSFLWRTNGQQFCDS